MANTHDWTDEEVEIFYEKNRNCCVDELIEWIVELLPQADFNSYISTAIDEAKEEAA